MGVFLSVSLTPEEVENLAESSHFNSQEILALYKRFQSLDRSKTGSLTRKELELIPELSMSPMCGRLIALMERGSSSAGVDFKQFVAALTRFHPRASDDERLAVMFECYDVDGDGFISEEDLTRVLRMLVGANLSESELHQIVRKSLDEALGEASLDRENRGLTLKEFRTVLSKEQVPDVSIRFPTDD